MWTNAARSKGTWVAMLAALVLGFALWVVLTSPGSHTKPAQAQVTEPDGMAFAKASLVVDGTEVGAFNEVVGITSSIKAPRAHGEAAQLTPPLRVVLKRPASNDLAMSAWHEAARTLVSGYKKDVTLILYDTAGTPVARFKLKNAWPTEYHLSTLKAGSSSILYEHVTLTADSFHRVAPS
jgi:phage tail-like protein